MLSSYQTTEQRQKFYNAPCLTHRVGLHRLYDRIGSNDSHHIREQSTTVDRHTDQKHLHKRRTDAVDTVVQHYDTPPHLLKAICQCPLRFCEAFWFPSQETISLNPPARSQNLRVIARRMNDNHADMDFHAMPPP